MAHDHEATLHPSPTNEYTRDLRAFYPTYEFRLLQTRLTIHALALSGTSTIYCVQVSGISIDNGYNASEKRCG